MVDRSCIGCKHFFTPHYDGDKHSYACCIYILNTGHPRPCPSGKGCTVREKRKRGRRPKGRSIK